MTFHLTVLVFKIQSHPLVKHCQKVSLHSPDSIDCHWQMVIEPLKQPLNPPLLHLMQLEPEFGALACQPIFHGHLPFLNNVYNLNRNMKNATFCDYWSLSQVCHHQKFIPQFAQQWLLPHTIPAPLKLHFFMQYS